MPAALDAAPRLRRQFRHLQAATVLSFAIAASCAVAAAILAAAAHAASLRQAGLPLLHVPAVLASAGAETWLPACTLLLASAAGVAISWGRLARLRLRLAVPALGALVLGTLALAPANARLLPFLPSQAERALMAGAPMSAYAIGDGAATHYVAAQLALRAGEGEGDAAALRHALRHHGAPLLDLADAWAYGLAGADNALLGFEPGIIHAIDAALHGKPETQIGMQWEQLQQEQQAQDRPWRAAVLGAGAGILLALAMASGAVWAGMVGRVRRIGPKADRWQ